jgi:arginyl-tRNA synthetase
MHYSIYQHLKTCLHAALEKAYPEQCPHLVSVPITFSRITPDPLTDIATPYPLQISQILRLPVTTVSQHILDHFQISSDYLLNTTDTIYCSGFFNFRMSQSLLLRSVYETCNDDCTLKMVLATNKPQIINKIELLLQKNVLENPPSIDNFITFPLPHSTCEHNAARLIAISCNDGIHSEKTCAYFKRQLLDEAKNFYRMCPIQSDDYQLSVVRFLIIKALYIRIKQMRRVPDDLKLYH